MRGVMENLPVLGMMAIQNAVWVALGMMLLALCLLLAWLRGGWSDRRRWRIGAAVFAGALPVAGFAALFILGGTPADMGYWLDWFFLAAISTAVAFYAALLAYLVVPPAEARLPRTVQGTRVRPGSV